MKVIKRDGRAVDYDRQKIAIAIGKANDKIPAAGRADKEEIKDLRKLGKKLQGHPDMKRIPGVDMSTGSLRTRIISC